MMDWKELFELAKTARARLVDTWDRAAKLYDGELSRPGKHDEWQPDVEIPIAWERAVAQSSRIVNVIVAQDPPFVATPKVGSELGNSVEVARAIEKYLQWKIRTWKEATRTDWPSWLNELVRHLHVYRMAVLHIYSRTELAPIFKRRTITEEVELPASPFGDGPERVMVTREVLTQELGPVPKGARVELVDPRDFFWYPLFVDSITDCSFVARRHYMTPWELERVARTGFFDPEAVRKVLEREPERQLGDEIERIDEPRRGFYEVLEAYYWEQTEAGWEEVVSFVEVSSETILRKEPNSFVEFRIPFVVIPYEWRSGSFIGPSFVERISGIHAAINAAVNLDLESSILANSMPVATDDDDVADELSDRTLRPGQVLRTTRPPREAIMPINFPGPNGQLGVLRSYMEQHADMISASSPAIFGIEQAQRPTFKGTAALIEESRQPLYRLLESIRTGLSEMAYQLIARDRETFDTRIPYFAYDEDGRILGQYLLAIPDGLLKDSVLIELAASSESFSKATRQEGFIQAINQVSNTYQAILGMLQLATQQPGVISLVAVKGARALATLLREAAKDFGIPGAELIAPDPVEDMKYGELVNQAFQAALSTISNPGVQPGMGQQGQGPPQGVSPQVGGGEVGPTGL